MEPGTFSHWLSPFLLNSHLCNRDRHRIVAPKIEVLKP